MKVQLVVKTTDGYYVYLPCTLADGLVKLAETIEYNRGLGYEGLTYTFYKTDTLPVGAFQFFTADGLDALVTVKDTI